MDSKYGTAFKFDKSMNEIPKTPNTKGKRACFKSLGPIFRAQIRINVNSNISVGLIKFLEIIPRNSKYAWDMHTSNDVSNRFSDPKRLMIVALLSLKANLPASYRLSIKALNSDNFIAGFWRYIEFMRFNLIGSIRKYVVKSLRDSHWVRRLSYLEKNCIHYVLQIRSWMDGSYFFWIIKPKEGFKYQFGQGYVFKS